MPFEDAIDFARLIRSTARDTGYFLHSIAHWYYEPDEEAWMVHLSYNDHPKSIVRSVTSKEDAEIFVEEHAIKE